MGSGSIKYKGLNVAGSATLVKTGKCSLCSYHIFNPGTVEAYVQLFDVASVDDPVVGTDPTLVLGVPAETNAGLGSTTSCSIPRPLQFTKGICAASTTAPDGDTAAPTIILFGIGD